MAADEMHPRITLISRPGRIVKNYIWALFQMTLETGVFDVADHYCRRSLKPDQIGEFASTQHRVQGAFYMADSACQAYVFSDQKIDRQIFKPFMALPGVDLDVRKRPPEVFDIRS